MKPIVFFEIIDNLYPVQVDVVGLRCEGGEAS
jgi:hypothetical protein